MIPSGGYAATSLIPSRATENTSKTNMVLEIIQALLGLLLTLFIPGYAFVLALYPKRKDLEAIERIALSSVLSIAATMLVALFLDLVLGVDYTTENMVIALCVFTAVCLAAWLAQTRGRYD